jgi:4-alpha-glucanotransferase
MFLKRSCGILLHISSLPGKYGAGSLGDEAFEFVDFLEKSGQTYWQILPHNPVCLHLGYSPYLSPSTHAGNPLFISLERLSGEQWMEKGVIPDNDSFHESDFCNMRSREKIQYEILKKCFPLFIRGASQDEKVEFDTFCKNENWWLNDYSMFMALAEYYNTYEWSKWPEDIARRNKKEMQKTAVTFSEQISHHKFIQFIYMSQWNELKKYCAKKKIKIIGDLPIYVGFDSADCWAHPEIFEIDEDTLAPIEVAGVPPDYFSPTGQRWGNPLYRWINKVGRLNDATVEWWIERIRKYFSYVDMIRIDHFRAFENYWAIPSVEKTAVKGRWRQGPGHQFFEKLKIVLGDIPLIAEDLGIITPEVEHLRDSLDLPGMKILQFAFDGNPKNSYLPHNIENPNCIVYTGTHDNDTTNGWYYGADLSDEYRKIVKKYMRFQDDDTFHWKLITYGYSTVARLVIIPAQDLLGYGREFRMNIPGVAEGNWLWKLTRNKLNDDISGALGELSYAYNRHSSQQEKQDDAV